MLQSPPLASMLPFHHAMQVAAAQVSKNFGLIKILPFYHVKINFVIIVLATYQNWRTLQIINCKSYEKLFGKQAIKLARKELQYFSPGNPTYDICNISYR